MQVYARERPWRRRVTKYWLCLKPIGRHTMSFLPLVALLHSSCWAWPFRGPKKVCFAIWWTITRQVFTAALPTQCVQHLIQVRCYVSFGSGGYSRICTKRWSIIVSRRSTPWRIIFIGFGRATFKLPSGLQSVCVSCRVQFFGLSVQFEFDSRCQEWATGMYAIRTMLIICWCLILHYHLWVVFTCEQPKGRGGG